MIDNHFDALRKYLDLYSSRYEKVLILDDLNADITEKHMKRFCDNYNLRSLIKLPACYKNPDNLTCIDLLLTNALQSFQSTCVLETGLLNFYLKELQNCIWWIIPVWSLFCSVWVYKSLHFPPIFSVKLGFRLSMF